jgi:hypothetical protein
VGYSSRVFHRFLVIAQLRLQQGWRQLGVRFGDRLLMLGLPAFEEGAIVLLLPVLPRASRTVSTVGFLPSSTSLVAAWAAWE